MEKLNNAKEALINKLAEVKGLTDAYNAEVMRVFHEKNDISLPYEFMRKGKVYKIVSDEYCNGSIKLTYLKKDGEEAKTKLSISVDSDFSFIGVGSLHKIKAANE